MPPSTARGAYIIGKTGSFECPTIAAVDQHVGKLAAQLPSATVAQWRRIWHDIDLLLERRTSLVKAAA